LELLELLLGVFNFTLDVAVLVFDLLVGCDQQAQVFFLLFKFLVFSINLLL